MKFIKNLATKTFLPVAFITVIILFVLAVIEADKADEREKIEKFHIWEKAYGNPNGITYEEFLKLKSISR